MPGGSVCRDSGVISRGKFITGQHMSDTYSYQTTFTLSKEYLNECYDQSVAQDPSLMKYKRTVFWLIIGLALQVSDLVSDYIAWFVISLAVLEVFSIRYHKTWWLWRQMLGKSYKSKVSISIDESGINTQSQHVDNRIEWHNVTELEKTSAGLIVRHNKGIGYLSGSYLDEVAVEYIVQQVKAAAE